MNVKFDANWFRAMARNYGIAQKKINDAFRLGGQEAGWWWINNCLPRHFTFAAYQLYGYARRSFRWNQKKLNAKRAYSVNTGASYPAEQPPVPMVWTGELRRHVLGRTNSYQVKATAKFATGDRKQIVRVSVPVGIPHPINPKNAGELTRIAPSEFRQMKSIVFQRARKLLVAAMHQVVKPGRKAA